MKRWKCGRLVKKCGDVKQLKQLHAQALLLGVYLRHQPLACQILNGYADLGLTSDAYRVFDQIPRPDIVSITSLISLHLQCDRPGRAVSVFRDVVASGLRPDGFVVVGALSASGRLEQPSLGESIHGVIYRRGLDSETVVSNALIDMYWKSGGIRSADAVFRGMVSRDAVSWSSMLNGCLKCHGLVSARKLFDEMPMRDTVSWTVMITGHVQEKQPVAALQLFRQMTLEGSKPSVITIVGVLSACADVGALDAGRAAHGFAAKLDAIIDVTLSNALIDMYSKSGNLQTAENIFNGMAYKDTYTWTSMISGFAVHGNATQAMEMFSEMLDSGINPNKITFLAVLIACSHGGLVAEGRKVFNEMRREHNIDPRIEHFGCMVDLLGRAGLLREAELLIQDMGMGADCAMWRSLLSASLVHGNIELAELAGKKIIEQEPDDDGAYVLLLNLYASSKRWTEALEMRKAMRVKKLLKKPGYSWIEVDGAVHEFLVNDKMHACEREIYLVLEEINMHYRTDGIVL